MNKRIFVLVDQLRLVEIGTARLHRGEHLSGLGGLNLLGSDLLGGRLTRLAFPLLKSVEWDHDSRQSTIGEKHAGKNYTGRVIV